MKLMLWWAQRIGVDGLAWSIPELQELVWVGLSPPLELYEHVLPDAAANIARTLALRTGSVEIPFRTDGPWVALGPKGWIVHDHLEVPLAKPFPKREQAEYFADLINGGTTIGVPCLFLEGLPRIQSIPMFGLGVRDDWFGARSPTRTASRRATARGLRASALT